MKKNELCRMCTLSALCLPAGGPKKLAQNMWVCERCHRALIKSGDTFVEVEPNIACWWLVVNVLTKDRKVCPPCGEEHNKREMENMSAMMEMVGKHFDK